MHRFSAKSSLGNSESLAFWGSVPISLEEHILSLILDCHYAKSFVLHVSFKLSMLQNLVTETCGMIYPY